MEKGREIFPHVSSRNRGKIAILKYIQRKGSHFEKCSEPVFSACPKRKLI
jgi:hypothetical protein